MGIKKRAQKFLKLCAAGKPREAFRKYAAEGIIHHNAYFPGDAESLQKGMEASEDEYPDKVFKVLRSARDGGLVFVHSKITMSPDDPDIAVVHILRFEAGKIAEFWDVIQPAPDEVINEHGMF